MAKVELRRLRGLRLSGSDRRVVDLKLQELGQLEGLRQKLEAAMLAA